MHYSCGVWPVASASISPFYSSLFTMPGSYWLALAFTIGFVWL